jgi:hypothetical protein
VGIRETANGDAGAISGRSCTTACISFVEPFLRCSRTNELDDSYGGVEARSARLILGRNAQECAAGIHAGFRAFVRPTLWALGRRSLNGRYSHRGVIPHHHASHQGL